MTKKKVVASVRLTSDKEQMMLIESYVINIDMPEDTMVYVHRTGRTGRAGKNGSAISLVAPKEVIRLTEYGKSIKIKLLAQEFNHGKLEEAIKKKNNKQIVSKNSKSFDKIKKEENKK